MCKNGMGIFTTKFEDDAPACIMRGSQWYRNSPGWLVLVVLTLVQRPHKHGKKYVIL